METNDLIIRCLRYDFLLFDWPLFDRPKEGCPERGIARGGHSCFGKCYSFKALCYSVSAFML